MNSKISIEIVKYLIVINFKINANIFQKINFYNQIQIYKIQKDLR